MEKLWCNEDTAKTAKDCGTVNKRETLLMRAVWAVLATAN
jgi:hypothetical protein